MEKHKKNKSTENESALKHLFNKALLIRMANSLARHSPKFNKSEFVSLMSELDHLEMKPRVRMIRDELKRQLPDEYPKALKILLRSVGGEELDGFDFWPYTEYVQAYGLEHIDISLNALREMTKKFTSEWAVRPFLTKYPEQTLKYLHQCAIDEDVRVRRWASEGSRPRLPWGERLQDFVKDPSATIEILEMLKFDSELYVRKSVSNHLNDIAKDHPERVVKILSRWKDQAGEKHAVVTDWIINRSLRSLIKEGHAGALKLIGVSKNSKVEFMNFKLRRKTIQLGDRLDFTFELKSLSKSSQKLVVDYVIHFVKSNKTTAPKVFKLKNLYLAGGEKLSISKSHHLKPVTTRTYYPGKNCIEIQVNGLVVGSQNWILK